MFKAVLIGSLCSLIVSALYSIPHLKWIEGSHVGAAYWIALITVGAIFIQRFWVDRHPGHRNYDGIADLILHIHLPGSYESPSRWGSRGIISSALSVFTGFIGPEGAATEFAQGILVRLRGKTLQWYEEKRRTDAGLALGASLAAVFSAPLASALLVLELGVGGRFPQIALSVLSAQIVQYLWVQFVFDFHGFSSFQFPDIIWPSLLSVKVLSSLFALYLIAAFSGSVAGKMIRYCQESLQDLIQTEQWIRTAAGGILLVLVFISAVKFDTPSIQSVFNHPEIWSLKSLSWFWLTGWIVVALVIAAFGTIGVFYPVFILGAALSQYFLGSMGMTGFWVIGGAVLLGASFRVPLAALALSLELTHHEGYLLLTAIGVLISTMVSKFLKSEPIFNFDLKARGLEFINGRATTILEGIKVSEAMVSDFEVVLETEALSQLGHRVLKSRYPFIPVVSAFGQYKGLLTVDLIQQGLEYKKRGFEPLSQLIEAKDLLYKNQTPAPTVKVDQRLHQCFQYFKDHPCLVVLGDDQRVQGLLLSYNVRLVYDREMSRKALMEHFSQ